MNKKHRYYLNINRLKYLMWIPSAALLFVFFTNVVAWGNSTQKDNAKVASKYSLVFADIHDNQKVTFNNNHTGELVSFTVADKQYTGYVDTTDKYDIGQKIQIYVDQQGHIFNLGNGAPNTGWGTGPKVIIILGGLILIGTAIALAVGFYEKTDEVTRRYIRHRIYREEEKHCDVKNS